MKIVQFTAENFKRLQAVEITPNGNLVQITGLNGAGKTSVLDGIWTALKGKSVAPQDPIHDGAERALLRLDLGELVVTRRFNKGGKDGYTTTVTVESADGAKFGSPQAVLDSLVGALALDPLAFVAMPAKEQFETLQALVPFDFAALERENAKDYEERTAVNRVAKDARTRAEAISVPKGAPRKRIDEDNIISALSSAADANGAVERMKARVERAEAERDRLHDEAIDLRSRAKGLLAQADEADAKAASLLEDIKSMGIPDPVDIDAIRAELERARAHNLAVGALEQREELMGDAEIAEQQSRELTERMAARVAAKTQAIQDAKLPVEGLDLEDGRVLLNGHPFGDASSAEQLRASIALAAAMNPKLRIIRCRDGSLLDPNGLKLVSEFADANDMQIWLERVDASGKIGFVIENGLLAASEAAE